MDESELRRLLGSEGDSRLSARGSHIGEWPVVADILGDLWGKPGEDESTRFLRRREIITGYTGGREVYATGHVWMVARRALDEAESQRDGSLYDSLVSIVFCAFTFEGILKQAADAVYCLHDERLRWKERTERLHSDLGIGRPDWGRRPLKGIADAFHLRDRMAHARTERAEEEPPVGATDRRSTRWEKLCDPGQARSISEDVEAESRRLWAVIEPGMPPPLHLLSLDAYMQEDSK